MAPGPGHPADRQRALRRTRPRAWTWAPTTTSPSRSIPTSWRPGCGPSSGGPRASRPGSGIVHVGNVEIDLERRLVTRDGELVSLSRTEWLLLQHLAVNAGKVVLHTELLTKVWGPEYRDDLQYLRVWISRVRRKLGAAPGSPGPITTFQGIGYVLNADQPVAVESAAGA